MKTFCLTLALLAFIFSSEFANSQNVESILDQAKSGNNWINYSKLSYTYDGNGYKTSQLYQLWDTDWKNHSKVIYTNNSNGTINYSTRQIWENNSWVSVGKSTYTYNSTSVNEAISDLGLIIYPNPVNDILYIKGKNNTYKIETIEIISIDGKIFKSFLSNDNSINVSHLPKGYFFIRLVLDGRICTIKFIKTNEN